MNEIIETLKKLKNQDETKWLETKKEILNYFFKSNASSDKTALYEEANRLAQEIKESTKSEKKLG